jgi:hypothetical protein
VTPTSKVLRETLVWEYLRALRDHIGSKRRHSARSLQQLGRAVEAGIRASRIEESLPINVEVIRSATAIEDAIQMLEEEETEEAEEA